MFLHIGDNYIVNENDLIMICNIESMKDTKEYKKLMKELKERHNLKGEKDIDPKSFIITKENNKIVGYETNISSITIAKRAQMNKEIK
ncbi:MAG TPA: DUF370 domain-containing protein [Candidatus Merdicola faecigallinarum]|uniref:DUF370 domain-containing protein n=1 Tax=Candidatus Merdicola faecigallinarum TaxID=2840862 RepID=A0A9D1S9Y9_9FIRM|nr:DUF370 domain-containing protein [Candidatus Merdicola faecigallinarum]